MTNIEDPREEALREAAAVGLLDKCTHYLQAGTNPNAVNKVNQWTALHWAAKRDQPGAVRLLLQYGADASVKNAKGELPVDLAKGAEVKELLGAGVGRGESATLKEEETEGKAFVPSYLASPPIAALYSEQNSGISVPVVPEKRQPPTITKRTSGVVNQESAQTLKPLGQAAPVPNPIETKRKDDGELVELLVYLNDYNLSRPNAYLHGALLAPANERLSETVQRLRDEMDGLPESIAITRVSQSMDHRFGPRFTAKQLWVPISSKQYHNRTFSHFKKGDVMLVRDAGKKGNRSAAKGDVKTFIVMFVLLLVFISFGP
ncbi:uncharacterized protein EV422DRAFT_53523 [Fimicolochytrium jonesii]|uniref:uncharacterized protein n=1 Tax=Fimicolochytrium jonesii TaxID=1396493 RepID=UPI0022FE02DC|nr:uncharacterized protein EV422DRAFT_53523 [Fimicolochytrium jonesii]KAI8821104.1 hypothetical protein EV422DRAFT_53523 [Fimicolochytrium jonesii]